MAPPSLESLPRAGTAQVETADEKKQDTERRVKSDKEQTIKVDTERTVKQEVTSTKTRETKLITPEDAIFTRDVLRQRAAENEMDSKAIFTISDSLYEYD